MALFRFGFSRIRSATSSAAAGALVATLLGCPEPTPMMPPDAATPSSASHLVFEPSSEPMAFGAIPFPDELYRDGSGRIVLGELPGEAGSVGPAFFESLRRGLAEIDGFGVNSPVFFPVRGGLEPGSLPTDRAATVRADASVFLVDVDPASPEVMIRVPAIVHWSSERSLLSVRPADGHPLREGRLYAAVVTSRVRGVDGLPLGPAPRFAMVRDSSAEPSDPVLARAWRTYRSVLASLAASGTPVSDVVGLAVFRVQTAFDELADVRAQIRGRPAPGVRIRRVASGAELDVLLGVPSEDVAGVDAPGGVRHAHIGWVVDGTFEAPHFGSSRPFAHGAWQRDGAETFAVARTDEVWFTLVLPRSDTTDVPLVVFQHGLGNDRSQVFSIADALAEAGYALAAIDIPFHGMRARAESPEALDSTHRFGSTMGPDLFGDASGTAVYVEYVGVFDEDGSHQPFHPFYPRDSFRQSVADLFALVDILERADWSTVTSAPGGPSELSFGAGPIGFVGVSLGGILGTMFVAVEERVGCAVLNVTGGNLSRLVELSAGFNGTFFPILFPKLGLDYASIDYAREPPVTYPQIAIYQTLLDRGDSMTFAPALRRRGVHVLFQMALDDETVPNLGTEALAKAAGASIAAADARYVDLGRVELPARPDHVIGGMSFVRTLTVFSPASHGLILSHRGISSYESPPLPPFVERPAPRSFDNPIAAAQGQIVRFFESWRAGSAEVR